MDSLVGQIICLEYQHYDAVLRPASVNRQEGLVCKELGALGLSLPPFLQVTHYIWAVRFYLHEKQHMRLALDAMLWLKHLANEARAQGHDLVHGMVPPQVLWPQLGDEGVDAATTGDKLLQEVYIAALVPLLTARLGADNPRALLDLDLEGDADGDADAGRQDGGDDAGEGGGAVGKVRAALDGAMGALDGAVLAHNPPQYLTDDALALAKREVRERLLGRHPDGLDNVLYELVAYCWGMEEGVQPQMAGEVGAYLSRVTAALTRPYLLLLHAHGRTSRECRAHPVHAVDGEVRAARVRAHNTWVGAGRRAPGVAPTAPQQPEGAVGAGAGGSGGGRGSGHKRTLPQHLAAERRRPASGVSRGGGGAAHTAWAGTREEAVVLSDSDNEEEEEESSVVIEDVEEEEEGTEDPGDHQDDYGEEEEEEGGSGGGGRWGRLRDGVGGRGAAATGSGGRRTEVRRPAAPPRLSPTRGRAQGHPLPHTPPPEARAGARQGAAPQPPSPVPTHSAGRHPAPAPAPSHRAPPTRPTSSGPHRLNTRPTGRQVVWEESPQPATRITGHGAAARRVVHTRGGQQRARARWEEGEVSRLCALYARHGPAWAHILKEDERRGRVLAARSQVDCKDKVRNLIKAGLIEPVEFGGGDGGRRPGKRPRAPSPVLGRDSDQDTDVDNQGGGEAVAGGDGGSGRGVRGRPRGQVGTRGGEEEDGDEGADGDEGRWRQRARRDTGAGRGLDVGVSGGRRGSRGAGKARHEAGDDEEDREERGEEEGEEEEDPIDEVATGEEAALAAEAAAAAGGEDSDSDEGDDGNGVNNNAAADNNAAGGGRGGGRGGVVSGFFDSLARGRPAA